jgi:hypothetical protein
MRIDGNMHIKWVLRGTDGHLPLRNPEQEQRMSDSDETFTPAEIAVLAKAARLPLTTERCEAVAPLFSGTLASFDALDAVDLGETPPTNSFDPRWRDLS